MTSCLSYTDSLTNVTFILVPNRKFSPSASPVQARNDADEAAIYYGEYGNRKFEQRKNELQGTVCRQVLDSTDSKACLPCNM